VFPALERFVKSQTWLDVVGDPLQKWLTYLLAGDGGKQTKNFLNGFWLGHPLHPELTAMPAGAGRGIWGCRPAPPRRVGSGWSLAP
jgi:hypothetical protein